MRISVCRAPQREGFDGGADPSLGDFKTRIVIANASTPARRPAEVRSTTPRLSEASAAILRADAPHSFEQSLRWLEGISAGYTVRQVRVFTLVKSAFSGCATSHARTFLADFGLSIFRARATSTIGSQMRPMGAPHQASANVIWLRFCRSTAKHLVLL